MSDTRALARLLTWLSPAFPVGTFAWSGGLETAIAGARVADADATRNWIGGILHHGSLRTDAILLAQAHRGNEDRAALEELADLCLALLVSAERREETLQIGEAFVIAARAWPAPVHDLLPSPCPYPIALGAIAAANGVGLEDAVIGFLTAAVQAQVSVSVRLVPIGQSEGLRIAAALEPQVQTVAAWAVAATLDDIGSIAYAADIAQMRHETLHTRLFRS